MKNTENILATRRPRNANDGDGTQTLLLVLDAIIYIDISSLPHVHTAKKAEF